MATLEDDEQAEVGLVGQMVDVSLIAGVDTVLRDAQVQANGVPSKWRAPRSGSRWSDRGAAEPNVPLRCGYGGEDQDRSLQRTPRFGTAVGPLASNGA